MSLLGIYTMASRGLSADVYY